MTKVPPVNELSNQSKFVQQLISGCLHEDLFKNVNENLGGVLYLDMAALTENDNELNAILYSFPPNAEGNAFCHSRGIYMTLNHLVRDITKQTPKITSFVYNNSKVNIVYNNPAENRIFLLSLSEYFASKQEVLLINNQILRFLEFTYQSIARCFETESLKNEIDSFFSRFFSRILKKNKSENRVNFEDIVSLATYLYLPKEAQLQIDDALTELEASDYREWVRLVFIFAFTLSKFPL